MCGRMVIKSVRNDMSNTKRKIEVRCIGCNALLFIAELGYTSNKRIEIVCRRCGLKMTYPSSLSNEYPDVVIDSAKRRGPSETN